MPVIYPQIKPFFMHRILGILELSHVYSVCGGFHSCRLAHGWWRFAHLSVASAYLITSDTKRTKVEGAGSLPFG